MRRWAGLGVLLAAITLAEFAASGLSGFIRERYGTIVLLVVPTLLAAAGLTLFAVALSWSTMIAAAAILGAGLGLLDAAVNMEAALRQGVRFMGALHASWAVGATLGPVLIGVALVASGSYRIGYAVAAIAFVVLAIAAVLARQDLDATAETDDAPGASGG